MGEPQHVGDLQGDIDGVDDAAPQRVVDVGVDIRDLVRQTQELPFQRLRRVRAGVAQDAPAHLIGEIEAVPIVFQPVHHPQRLDIVLEPSGHDLVQDPLPRVAKGRMAQIMSIGSGFGQVLIELQPPGNGPGDPHHLDGMGHAGAVMVSLRLEKYLRLVHQAPERLGVDDAVDIPLKAGAHRTGLHRPFPAFGVRRQTGIGGQKAPFLFLAPFSLGQPPPPPLVFST